MANSKLQKHQMYCWRCVRHPHQNVTLFHEKIEQILESLNKSKSVYYIAGDTNINSLKSNSDSLIKNYLNMIYSQGCIPTITHPTRITSTSSTLIDHIYTNNFIKEMKSFILLHDLTDHFPILVSTNFG